MLPVALPITLPIRAIVQAASEHFSIPVADLRAPSRNRRRVYIRHLVMYVARQNSALSFRQIVRALGRVNHATSFYGVSRIKSMLTDPQSVAHSDVAALTDAAKAVAERSSPLPHTIYGMHRFDSEASQERIFREHLAPHTSLLAEQKPGKVPLMLLTDFLLDTVFEAPNHFCASRSPHHEGGGMSGKKIIEGCRRTGVWF